MNATTDVVSIFDLLKNFADKSLLMAFNSIDKDTLEIAICAVFTIVGASSYMYYKIKGNKINQSNNRGLVRKEKNFLKYSKNLARSSFYSKSKQDCFKYHKILNELHTVCDNCSNVYSSMKCIQLISDYPELVNVKLHSDGLTPFHRICSRGNDILMEFMLAKGADPELTTADGENALCKVFNHYLLRETKNFKCLDILYRKGCHFNTNDKWYAQCLNLAFKCNNKRLVEWLITHSKSQLQRDFSRASSNPL